MTAAIYYYPDAYSTRGRKLMGRNSAGESFLRGFLASSKAETFWTLTERQDHAQLFAADVRKAGRLEPVRAVSRKDIGALAQPGAVYYPAPNIGELGWQRAASGHDAWSLCGITHTISSAAAMDGLTSLLTAPIQPWDAVICTSTLARDVVQRVLQAQASYLRERLGAQRLVLPQLPVIPLGIHAQDFDHPKSRRLLARQSLGANENTLVVLFAGRLSFHAKAHPLAMYQALELAVAELAPGQNVLLVECGQHANESIAQAFEVAARAGCPSVRTLFLDGRKDANYQNAWAGADVFCSLSDNLQETFGLTPIEAMAAGLPVVVSDWDGYKDTVREGIDGFRIPTLMPVAGFGGDLAMRHAQEVDTYDMYCGHTCSLVAVDVQAAAQAFSRLFASPALRRQMGESGRRRAHELFDWSVIIPRYEKLWAELAELRHAQGPMLKRLQHPWPSRMDPFHAFASYPTQALTPDTTLALIGADSEAAARRVAACRQLDMVNFARYVLPTENEVRIVLDAAANGPLKAADLVQSIARPRQVFVLRGLAWLVKLGVLRGISADPKTPDQPPA